MQDHPTTKTTVKRRSELTFRHNTAQGRHGWLRLTPAYSIKVVEQILDRHHERLNVFDPFSGTATTALCAAMRGHHAVALDINPFLVWFGNAKVCRYSEAEISQVNRYAAKVVESSSGDREDFYALPPLFNIERWWQPEKLRFLCRIMRAIRNIGDGNRPALDLLLIAFGRTMIALSNAAFNHQSMSFKAANDSPKQLSLFTQEQNQKFERRFLNDVEFVVAGAAENPPHASSILLADSRHAPQVFDDGADLLITSPPYPNRMSYIRELRPYMYWLGFLKEAREAGELDWQAIGGTWGIATSRVANWHKKDETYFPDYLSDLLEKIRSSDAKSGDVLSRYVGKYFEDIWQHLNSVVKLMKPSGEMHYIVGNSKFYSVLVPVENIYRDMLKRIGVANTTVIPLRKRNSKKELIEFDVASII
jgi:hypothetical protein